MLDTKVKVKRSFPDALFIPYYLLGMTGAESLFRLEAYLARKAGIDKLYFVISLDCDTDMDAQVAWEVHSRLMDIGVRPVYAVPGQLLEKNEKTYARIAGTGAEFINHGYTEHVYAAKNESNLFYDRLSKDAVTEDISKGGDAVNKCLGISPKGFRAPHFGTFQKQGDIAFLHSVLKDMGYLFSSSTIPYYGFRYGPVFDISGVKEFPLSGKWTKPMSVLDSWHLFDETQKIFNGPAYAAEIEKVAGNLGRIRYTGILNYYADPSHIYKSTHFFDAMAKLSSIGRNENYEGLLKELSYV